MEARLSVLSACLASPGPHLSLPHGGTGRYCYVPLLVYAAMGTSSFVSVGPVALVSTTLHGMIAYVADPAARYQAIPSPNPSPDRNST